MAGAPRSLFEAVREACPPATWSRGVELTRADAVVGERADGDEIVFRVTTRGGMVCPRVTLFPAEPGWDCECTSHEAACEHVAAAVIAWQRGLEQGAALPSPKREPGRVSYRFSRSTSGLALERRIESGEESRRLETSLTALAERRVDGPRFLATRQDLALELILGLHRRGPLAARLLPKLFAELAHCADVRLDDRPVRVASEPLLPRARLEDEGPDFRLTLVEESEVTERFVNGAALCGDTLRWLGDPKLTGWERHEFGRGKRYGQESVAELVTDVLPSLRSRIPVDVLTTRLPSTVGERPRAELDVSRAGATLSVLPTLVYGDPPIARVDGGRLIHLGGPVPLRDRRLERLELQELGRLGLQPGVRVELTGVEAVAFRASLAGFGGRVRGAGLDHFALAGPLEPRLDVGEDRLDLTFESTGGPRGRRAGAADVLRAWGAGDSLVALDGGGYAPLPADWLQRFGHRVSDLLAARDAEGRVPRCCLGDLARLYEDLDHPPPPRLAGLRALLEGFASVPAAPLPQDLGVGLREYQKRGLDWLVFMREAGLGALLADDMGLGKTLQALCALRPRALVVVPTSVLHNWVDEMRKHRPGLSYNVYHGPRRALVDGPDVTLTTYSILRLDADLLAAQTWETVVLDEAQNIKNPDSRVASAAFRLQAPFKLALTGTPVENRLDELWSQFHFANRGLLGGRRDFQEHYAEPIGRGDEDAVRRLRERIRPFVLRRLKREVAPELPSRTEMVLHCELSPAERQVYDAVRASTLEDLVRRLDAGGSVLAALEALLRLRQAACHSALVPGQEAAGSSKLSVLLEALDSVIAEGHKALVFSQWTSLLDLVEPHLRAGSIDFVRLDGSTRDRAAVVERFQSSGGPPLMLISLKAGGTGLNLTAADHVFLLDPWWNPAVEDQAADRTHRIGQDRPVMIYRVIAEDTVEERILELQQRKRALAGAALDGGAPAAGLTRQDLLDLLRG